MSGLVSVVIPSYNHEKFISEAILSVYNQTYENLELILIDDCSSDNTFRIAEELLSSTSLKNRFVKIICQKNEENMGAHATLNKAISYANGTYISILNSDDYYDPTRIEKMVNVVKDYNINFAFVFSNYFFVDETDEVLTEHPLYIELQTALKDAREVYPSLSFIFLQKQVALSTGNFFFSKSLYLKVGGFINLRYCHDLDFILQCIRYTEPIFIDEPIYYYRIHSGNTFSEVKCLAIPETEVCLIRYFEEAEYGELLNQNAPCRKNFPYYFEILIKNFNLENYYIKALTGYSKVHRVIDKNLFKRYEI